MKAQVNGEVVVELIQLFEGNGLEVYVDGGWGVDALLGEQTRLHSDLDIALPHEQVPKLRELLEARGYKDVPRPDTRDCNFVLGDHEGHLVDVHSYMFDPEGHNIFGVAYLPEHLTGAGTIKGHPVRCISPEWMVKFHTGYEVDEDDYRDVKALCQRFGIAVPSEYERFEQRILPFVSGLELSGGFFQKVVRPIVERSFPSLPYAAALIGPGSDVLGFDDEMSRDHEWGPRGYIFLREEDQEFTGPLYERLAQDLPDEYLGYPLTTSSYTGEIIGFRGQFRTLRDFIRQLCALDIHRSLDVADWLTIPSQQLLEITSGAVLHDAVGDLTALRQSLAYYPHDIWLYLLASSWQRISQEEHLMPRAGYVGDELGSALIGSRLVHDVMSLCFLMEKRYAPYPKWFGTAFQKLSCASHLTPILRRAQTAESWQEREAAICDAYEHVAGMHNTLGITAPLPTEPSQFWGRPFRVINGEVFAQAICQQIVDPQVKRLTAKRLIGNIDQISDNTDLRSSQWRPALRNLYL